MYINYCTKDSAFAFDNIASGEVFLFNDIAYMKATLDMADDTAGYAVNLETGESQHFGRFVPVTKVTAELIVK